MLGSKDASKASLVCGVTDDLVERGLDASELIKTMAADIKGSGGGRPDMAQAGGGYPAGLESALRKGIKAIEEGQVK
jgi:alanyl-tRNA synthetase